MAAAFELLRIMVSHARRIADIHLAAMDLDPLLHAQFASPEILEALRESLCAYTTSAIRAPDASELITRDAGRGTVAGITEWVSPSTSDSPSNTSSGSRECEGYAMLLPEMPPSI
jgi:hypothetical protein